MQFVTGWWLPQKGYHWVILASVFLGLTSVCTEMFSSCPLWYVVVMMPTSGLRFFLRGGDLLLGVWAEMWREPFCCFDVMTCCVMSALNPFVCFGLESELIHRGPWATFGRNPCSVFSCTDFCSLFLSVMWSGLWDSLLESDFGWPLSWWQWASLKHFKSSHFSSEGNWKEARLW